MTAIASSQLSEPVVPGEILSEELDARGWSHADFGQLIDHPSQLVSAIVKDEESITPEIASKIAATLGTSTQMWLNLQRGYDLAQASRRSTALGR